MEFDIVDYSKQRLTFRLKNEGHTFCNLLRHELWNDKATVTAGYRIEHTLESVPFFILETEDKDTKKVLLDTGTRLQKLVKEARSKILKVVK